MDLSDVQSIVVLTQQKESSGKCLLCISIKQCIDNMYTQVAIHSATIGSEGDCKLGSTRPFIVA